MSRRCDLCDGRGIVMVPRLSVRGEFPGLVEAEDERSYMVRCRPCDATGEIPPKHRKIMLNGGWAPGEREKERQ